MARSTAPPMREPSSRPSGPGARSRRLPDTRKPNIPSVNRQHAVAADRVIPSRRASGDPLPAQLAGFPAGDGLVPADYLDLPQLAAVAVHCLLRLDHSVDGGGLRDRTLGAGLLDKYEIGRAGISNHVT